jgi:SAM-dependent methyltransferase
MVVVLLSPTGVVPIALGSERVRNRSERTIGNEMNFAKIDYLWAMLEKFYMYPSSALWRAIELQILSGMKYESPILDLGCADGFTSSILFGEKRLTVRAGLDISKRFISEAKKMNHEKYLYDSLIIGDAGDLPYPDESFSVVFSNCVLEHILDLEKVLQEVSRVLAYNGSFIFTVPSHFFGGYSPFHSFFQRMGWSRLASSYVSYVNNKLVHYHCYPPEIWQEYLSEAGLTLTDYGYYVSPRAARIFDVLEFLYTIGIGKLRLHAFLIRASLLLERLGINFHRRLLVKAYHVFLKKYLLEETVNHDTGAGLFLVAVKR